LTEPDLPFVSVVIPVFRNHDGLKRCLNALSQQDYPSESYEVIVVNNALDDEILDTVAGFSNVVTTVEAIPGSYAARNKGISMARGAIVAFTDSDCVPAPNWLNKGVHHLLQQDNCGLLAGRVELFFKNVSTPTAIELFEATVGFPFDQERYLREGRFGATANVFTRQVVLQHVGPFDAELKSGGDLEWGRRVHHAGYAQAYAPDVVVGHPARATLRALHRRVARVMGGAHDVLVKLHGPPPLPYLLKFLYGDFLAPAITTAVRGPSAAAKRRPISALMLWVPFSSIPFLWRSPGLQHLPPSRRVKVVFATILFGHFMGAERLRLYLGGRSRRD
jgi:glycosyltransferase involved in cell wall biosynthesis